MRRLSRLGRALAVGVAALCFSAGVAAQTPPAQGQGAGGGARGQNPGFPQVTAGMNPNDVERLFDTYELFQAQGALGLDSRAFLVFGEKLQQYQRVRSQHQVARQRLLAEINNLLKPGATTDEATLTAKTKALDDLELQNAQDERAALAAVDLTLDVRQRARLRVFINNQERKKLELIALARLQAQQQIKAPDPAPVPGKIIK